MRYPPKIALLVVMLCSVASAQTLTFRVLQTEQVPYTVKSGGGDLSTYCSIGGTTNTYGSAVTSGNYTFGNATSYSNLSMSCNTHENPPVQWRHILNTMLVVASNNNAYIIACDAAWRWSKCRGLRTGDTFSAQWAKGGLAVSYRTDKGKEQQATYAVLKSQALATPTSEPATSRQPTSEDGPINSAWRQAMQDCRKYVGQPDYAWPIQCNSVRESLRQESTPSLESSGVCRITSVPDAAEVHVDGDFVGNTPTKLSLSPGKHTVHVSAAGYKQWEREITVSTGSELTLAANLEKE